jgi:hypothetical protein
MEAEPTVGEDGTRTHMSHTICESKTSIKGKTGACKLKQLHDLDCHHTINL